MNAPSYRRSNGWGTRLLIGLVLVLLGAAAAVWALARYEPAARFLGISSAATAPPTPKPVALSSAPIAQAAPLPPSQPGNAELAQLEDRLARVENATQRAEGSAGRADALVVAFAARRAIDRGVALGYLEKLLVERFAPRHPGAVATIISASHQPVRLNDLIAEYETLGPDLRRGGPNDSWWTNVQRGFGSLIEVHRADSPAKNPDARYNRAMQRLSSGEVDQALAETMRLPGAGNAGPWVAKARRYVAAHRALERSNPPP